MQTIIVTGGAGYIGSHVVRRLLDFSSTHQMRVVVIDNFCTGHRSAVPIDARVSVCECDISDLAALRAAFASIADPVTAVMHLAALSSVAESERTPAAYFRVNVAGTQNVLLCMIEKDIKMLVFSSSASVFGDDSESDGPPVHVGEVSSVYAKTKRLAENTIAKTAAMFDIQFTCLRYFNAAGADDSGEIGELHDPETHLIPNVLAVAAGKAETLRIFGTDYPTVDGTCVRDYIHVSDIAGAHTAALAYMLRCCGSKRGLFIELGAGEPFSVLEIVEAARRVTSQPIPTVECPRRPGDPAVLYSKNKGMQSLIGWSPQITDIDAIIKSAWKFMRISQKTL